MISRISVMNFKSLRDMMIDLAPLTILTGLNGSGKSSLIQLLLLMRQNAVVTGDPVEADLNSGFLRLGTQSDVQYCYNEGMEKAVVSIESDRLDASYKVEMGFDAPFSDTVILRQAEDGTTSDESRRANLVKYLNGIQYISAERGEPRQEHEYSSAKIRLRQWGLHGENAVAFLAEFGATTAVEERMRHPSCSDPMLAPQVNAWLGVVSHGASVNMKVNEVLRKVELSFSFASGVNKHLFRPQNVGFGLSYVLSLLIMILTSREGDCLILENPEAHIHPRGQAEIGRLMSLAASAGVQIIVETHSDHILNGVRVAVRQRIIDKHAACIQFFNRVSHVTDHDVYEEYSVAHKIEIDSNGELSDYPEDFMEEWDRQLRLLV